MKKRKAELRKVYLEIRATLPDEVRQQSDWSICQLLTDSSLVDQGGTIAAYISDGNEPDLSVYLRQALEQGHQVLLPRMSESGDYEMVLIPTLSGTLVAGAFGILEPKPELKAVELAAFEQVTWLVPGVCFTRQGGRLGRGKGVYDRLMEHSTGLKVGICYECQFCEELPIADHDLLMDAVVTERMIYKDMLQK